MTYIRPNIIHVSRKMKLPNKQNYIDKIYLAGKSQKVELSQTGHHLMSNPGSFLWWVPTPHVCRIMQNLEFIVFVNWCDYHRFQTTVLTQFEINIYRNFEDLPWCSHSEFTPFIVLWGCKIEWVSAYSIIVCSLQANLALHWFWGVLRVNRL